jgi:hypothetical protein
MTDNVSWVQAKLSDSKVASLIARLAKAEKTIETGGCGCGCGDSATNKKS